MVRDGRKRRNKERDGRRHGESVQKRKPKHKSSYDDVEDSPDRRRQKRSEKVSRKDYGRSETVKKHRRTRSVTPSSVSKSSIFGLIHILIFYSIH
ncbi:hypothetical protein ACS0TY_018925 [Phlomoides rotata]